MDGSNSFIRNNMELGHPLAVRKGAWTEQEDVLLKNFIHKYGEGKWHQIPSRAGLNRCRKSCRLRWLNYLRPNIKRGEFSVDEVDLIIRLHKLLGNRWSLIAGRIPGRTANDVKNYWNTNLCKKLLSSRRHDKVKYKSPPVIKPQPRTFSKSNTTYLRSKTHFTHEKIIEIENNNNPTTSKLLLSPPSLLFANETSEVDLWWESLVVGDKIDTCSISWLDQDEPIIGNMWSDQQVSSSEGTNFDMEIWNLLDLEN